MQQVWTGLLICYSDVSHIKHLMLKGVLCSSHVCPLQSDPSLIHNLRITDNLQSLRGTKLRTIVWLQWVWWWGRWRQCFKKRNNYWHNSLKWGSSQCCCMTWCTLDDSSDNEHFEDQEDNSPVLALQWSAPWYSAMYTASLTPWHDMTCHDMTWHDMSWRCIASFICLAV